MINRVIYYFWLLLLSGNLIFCMIMSCSEEGQKAFVAYEGLAGSIAALLLIDDPRKVRRTG